MNDIYITHKEQFWTKHGSYLYSPFPGKEVDTQILSGLNENYLFARNSYDFDLEEATEWWYIVKDRKEDIADYSSNHRNQVRKGLKNFECKRVDYQEILNSGHEIYMTCMRQYELPAMDRTQFCKSIVDEQFQHLDIEYFGVYKEDILVGYAKNLIDDVRSFVFYENIYVDATYRKLYPNYCLLHKMNTEYLNNRGFKYVSDGTRTLLHPTGIQDFLIKKFLFRKAYCRLQILYSMKAKVGVFILSQINKIARNSLFHKNPKVKALILQHEIYRSTETESL